MPASWMASPSSRPRLPGGFVSRSRRASRGGHRVRVERSDARPGRRGVVASIVASGPVTIRRPPLRVDRQPGDEQVRLVGQRGQPLVGDADEVAVGARAGVHRDDPGADLVADDDHGTRPLGDRREAGGDGAVEDRIDGRDVVAEERAEPERQAVDQDRLVGSVARQGGDEVGADLDRRPGGRPLRAVAGDAVVELGVARASAVARNQARPPRRRDGVAAASPNRLLPLRVPPSARISGSATLDVAGSSGDGRDDQRRRHGQLDRSRPSRRRRAAARPRTIAAATTSPTPRRRARRARSGRARGDRRDRRSRSRPMTDRDDRVAPPDARREPAAEPARLDAGRGRASTVTTGSVRPTTAATMSAAPAASAPADVARLASAATSIAEHEDERDRAAGPDGRVLPGALGVAGSGARSASAVSASPSRWSAPVSDGHRRDREDRREDRLAGAPRSERHGTDEPDDRADERERRGAARGAASAGRDRQPGQQGERGPHDAADPGPSRGHRRAGRGGTSTPRSARPERQADEGRIDAEHAPDVAAVERRRGRSVGDDPAVAS